MRISELVPWLVRSSGSYWGEFLFLEVRTDEGVSGWGEITTTTRMANRSAAVILRNLNELLVGEDAAAIERIWHKVFRSFTYMGSRGAASNVTSAVDIALWDLRGKALGLPVHALLGGRVHDELRLYTHPDQSRFTTPEGLVDEIGLITGSGHTAIKFDPFPHPVGAPPTNDAYLDGYLPRQLEREAIELTAAIREAAGPDVELLIDAHGRFDVPTAIRLCRALEAEADIHWFEEPVPPESYHALRQVRQRTGIPISVGERLHTRWDFVPVFEQELADFAMPDVTWTGGISELKKISTMAEAYNVPMSPHDAAGPVNLLAGGHVMATVPNFYRLESSSYDLHGYNELLTEPLTNVGGALQLPDRPGLGVEFDLDHLRANVLDGFGG
ncbi:mandelate racemase/muconate lactonizing enzyme family protein [Gryllotalpicola protaetiae]|uniref:Mandelate racemase/muconate lactonizing enzyme family protein n=1 Tax=Gryllotalpicola protaetiae TaxID=2419771 RepID=A0A387BIK0_9MICO|nr:mandelate racemase/muconate lactonizing enzyme family protein [Gryllotalpicola protaetiae]AYG03633.1 mandelate racemase/muconate lactonizing enzyme family protein [Gryllotalpicola protaetiae]